jgi:hypothetical protein
MATWDRELRRHDDRIRSRGDLCSLPPFMKRLLLFERQLAVECDTACHTVAEAQGEPDAGDGAASAETLH